MKLKAMLCLLLSMLIVGCNRVEVPVSDASSNNPSAAVVHLLTVDGCKVYRFHDAGEYRYIANCSGATSISALPTKSCGANCIYEFDNSTITLYGQPAETIYK